MTTDFTTRVRKGIAAIEAYEPGATDRIDLDTIDVGSSEYCPVAQSIGDYDYGDGLLRMGMSDLCDDDAAARGFLLVTPEIRELTRHGLFDEAYALYAPLTEAWITELTAHRTAKAAIVAD